MKIQKRLPVLLLAVLLALLTLSGCESAPKPLKEQLIGTWEAVDAPNSGSITFNSDGTVDTVPSSADNPSTWSLIDDNTLKIQEYYGDSSEFTIEIDGNTLTMTMYGQTVHFNRVK